MTEQSMHYLVEIESQPIELYKLLKIANLVAGGGEAKIVISEGYVYLNDEIETQKRKKVFSGDIIAFNGDFVEVLCHNPPQEQQKKVASPSMLSGEGTSENTVPPTNTSTKGQTGNNKRAGKPNQKKNKKQSTQHKKNKSDNAPSQNLGKRRPINF